MRSLSLTVCSAVLVFSSLAACSSDRAAKDKSASDTSESDLHVTSVTTLGPIAPGESKSVAYEAPPKYLAYTFTAAAGDKITVDVGSPDHGDAMVWITSSSYTTLASNDDASDDTLDSHATYEVPATAASKSYKIVFRDYDQLDATFEVKLAIESAAPPPPPPPPPPPACDPQHEPNRNYLGNATSCKTIRYFCDPGWTSFGNACGCGCEH